MTMNIAPPRVSVGLPTYNRPDYLRLAIESVLAQTFTDWELVITDNSSTDESEQVAASFGDPRIRYFRNERNIGLTGNLNRSLELARGEYATILCDDDLFLPEHLARKVPHLDSNPSVGFVHSNIYRIDGAGKVIGQHWIEDRGGDRIEPGLECFLRLFSGGNFIALNSMLFRREPALQWGAFDPRLGFVADWLLCLRFALHYDVAYLTEPLICYRLHQAMETTEWTGRLREIREYRVAQALLFESHGHLIPDAARLEREADWTAAKRALRLARRLARCGEYDQARACIAFAGKTYPSIMKHPRGLYARTRVAVGQRIHGC